jgi:hypothetical protein
MQRLLYLWLVRILLQIHDLLEVDLLTTTLAFLGVLTCGLFVVAHAFPFLAFLGTHVLDACKRKDGLRMGATFFFSPIGLVRAHSSDGHDRLLYLRRAHSPGVLLPFLPFVFVESLRFGGEAHVVFMYFLVLGAVAKLVGACGVVGGLGGDAAEGEVGVSELVLEDAFVLFVLDAFGGGEDAGPVAGVSEFDGGVSEELFLAGYFLEQFVGFLLGVLAVLVELFLVFLQLHEGRITLTTKLFILRLYFSIRAGRIWLWYCAAHLCMVFLRLSSCWSC